MCHGNPSNSKAVSTVHLDWAVMVVCVRETHPHTHTQRGKQPSKSVDTHPHSSVLMPALKSYTVNINQFFPQWHSMELALALSISVLERQQNFISALVRLFSLVTTLIFQPLLSLWHLCFTLGSRSRKHSLFI